MRNETKIKYLAEIFAFAFVFMLFVSPVFASEITPSKVIKLVNTARQKEGLAPLVQNDTLMQIATDKLNDMIKNEYFAHTSPTGKTPWSWFVREKYDYQYAGENLAINFTSAEEQQKAWMESPTHRKNILNVNYQEIGVAFGAGEIDGKMSLITVQEFGTRVGVTQAVQDGSNFLMQKGTDMLEDGTKILPQVLSVKADVPQKNGTGDGVAKINPADIWPNISNALSVLTILLFLGSLVMLPISFLAVAYDKIYILFEMRKATHQT
jgi:hypothetical protein